LVLENQNLMFNIRFPYSTFVLLLSSACQAQVSITDGVISEGQQCFRIETPSATYLYQKEAGGFSNILDRNGTDWIQFHKSREASYPASAASDYRGLPNLVFRSDDGGAGHPGFDKMTSEIVAPNQIRSRSHSGKWQWNWTFYEKFAELSVVKIDTTHAYWFLYEGPIAGKFSPSTHYWGTDSAGPLTAQPDLVKGPQHYAHWQTVYFGDTGDDQVFFVHQTEQDTLRDLYTYMGNSAAGNEAEDGMVVFGFGRAPGATPLIRQPQKFRIGFYPGRVAHAGHHLEIIRYIEQLKP
jgi:hypothetical protein